MGKIHSFWNGPAPMAIKMPPNLVPYNMIETDDDSVEVEMYGEVVSSKPTDWWGEPIEGLYIVLSDFLNDLENYKEKNNITFRINSPGGEVFAGITIRNRMAELKGTVTTIVDGLSASAASVIAQGATPGHRKVCNGSLTMIHGASSMLFGYYNAKDMKDVLKQVNAIDKSIAEIYAKCTGLDQDKIKSMMNDTTWMSAQEAIDKGFADEMVETDKVTMSLNSSKSLLTVNGIPMPARGLFNLPDNIPVNKEVSTGTEPDDINKNPTGGKEKMTLEELRKSDPELVEQIRNEAINSVQETQASAEQVQTAVTDAITAERQRLQDIESIENSIGDKTLINSAKYGEKPMTAQELAFEAMKNQAVVGGKVLDGMKVDAKASGAEGVGAAPNSGETAKEQEVKDIADGAALIAGATQEGAK